MVLQPDEVFPWHKCEVHMHPSEYVFNFKWLKKSSLSFEQVELFHEYSLFKCGYAFHGVFSLMFMIIYERQVDRCQRGNCTSVRWETQEKDFWEYRQLPVFLANPFQVCVGSYLIGVTFGWWHGVCMYCVYCVMIAVYVYQAEVTIRCQWHSFIVSG